MFVGNAAILLQLHRQKNIDLSAGIISLTKSPLGILIVLSFSLVLVTMITQAFAFEVIRLLEGYWGSVRILSHLNTLRTTRHVNLSLHLREQRNAYQKEAFARAKKFMLEKNFPRVVIEISEDMVYGRSLNEHPHEDIERATKTGWRTFSSPALLRRVEALEFRMRQYPRPHRILPTRLGNTLRATEDSLDVNVAGDIEGFILRNYNQIPEILRSQHEQFRTRLDMYCILVFVFAALAILAPTLLFSALAHPLPSITAFLLYFMLSWVSYEAALASARGYGSILRAVNSWITNTVPSEALSEFTDPNSKG